MTKLVIFGDSDLEGIKSILRRARLGKMIRTAEIGRKQQPTIEEFINDQISRSYIYRFAPIVAEFRSHRIGKPQITVREGNQNDNTERNYIYDSENNKLGIILDSKIEKKKKKWEHILFPRIKNPNYKPLMEFIRKSVTTLPPEFFTKLHTGNVLLLNINGNKNLYFVIDDIEKEICYCVNYSLVTDYISEKIEKGTELIISQASESLIKSKLEKLHEIDLPEYTDSYTINKKLYELLNNASNSDLELTESDVIRINAYLDKESEGASFNPDNVGFGRKKESRKKGRRKAKPAPKGKPMPKDKPKATKKRKKVKRKTK